MPCPKGRAKCIAVDMPQGTGGVKGCVHQLTPDHLGPESVKFPYWHGIQTAVCVCVWGRGGIPGCNAPPSPCTKLSLHSIAADWLAWRIDTPVRVRDAVKLVTQTSAATRPYRAGEAVSQTKRGPQKDKMSLGNTDVVAGKLGDKNSSFASGVERVGISLEEENKLCRKL